MEKITKFIDGKEPEQLSIPLSEDQVIVRPELNTSKFADFIFPPSHGKDLTKTRVKKWKGTLPNGKEGDIFLRVSPTESFKAPSHTTYKVLLALYDIWHERRLTDGTCICSMRDILKRLKLSVNSSKNTKMIERELDALRETIIAWNYSFLDESGEGKMVRKMNILSSFEYDNIVSPDKQFTSRVQFRFDENIQRNLEINKTKPFQLGVLLSISGEIASVLYTRLDIIMSVRERPYERTSKGLFEDLDLDSEKYQYPSRRKAKLESVIKQINGKKISTGEILVVRLAKTVDGSDWKIVVNKDKPKGLPKAHRPSLPIVNDKKMVVLLAEDIAAVLGDLETHRGLYERLCMHYSVDLIYRALGEFKADGGLQSTYKRRYFVAMLHRLAHESGLEWIKNCGSDCKYRNMLV